LDLCLGGLSPPKPPLGDGTECTPPDKYGFKICEKLTKLRWSKRHMWHNETVLEEYTSGTPL